VGSADTPGGFHRFGGSSGNRGEKPHGCAATTAKLKIYHENLMKLFVLPKNATINNKYVEKTKCV